MELGGTIRKLRTEKGWSQEQLAERAYVSRQTVSNWETGKSCPDVQSLLLLGGLFGVSLDELIKGDVDAMRDTVRNEDGRMLRRLQWLGVIEILALIAGATVLVESGSPVGMMLGCIMAGALAVGIMMTFHAMEQIKERNDVQTYREVLALINGTTLDGLRKEKEQKARRAQRRLLIATAVQGAVLLAGALIFAVTEII